MFTVFYILSSIARLIAAVAISYYLVYHRNIDKPA